MHVPIGYGFTVKKCNWYPIHSLIRKAELQLK